MLAFVIIGILVTVSAAPKQKELSIDDDQTFENYIENEFNEIDAESRAFWKEYETEIQTFEEKLKELSRHFPNSILQEGFDGDKYVIKVSLHGFEEDDISVKMKDKTVVIIAHNSNGYSDNRFFNVRNLPNKVKFGTWTYGKDILTVECELQE